MKIAPLFSEIPELAELFKTADVIDVKTIEGPVALRPFLAGMLSYFPAWVRALYAVRWAFVRLLGMKQEGVPGKMRIEPDEISFVPGDCALFFTVDMAKEGHYYVASATESHLTAHLGVVREGGTGRFNRFHVVTLVHYNNWTGPVYFNVIRPFHHIVVAQMMKAGVATAQRQLPAT